MYYYEYYKNMFLFNRYITYKIIFFCMFLHKKLNLILPEIITSIENMFAIIQFAYHITFGDKIFIVLRCTSTKE